LANSFFLLLAGGFFLLQRRWVWTFYFLNILHFSVWIVVERIKFLSFRDARCDKITVSFFNWHQAKSFVFFPKRSVTLFYIQNFFKLFESIPSVYMVLSWTTKFLFVLSISPVSSYVTPTTASIANSLIQVLNIFKSILCVLFMLAFI